jgi:rRNA small subunit pseudouridine methyltransferase Nep1
LLQVIKNPITQHFPSECVKIGLSHKAQKLVDVNDYVEVNFGEGSEYKDKPVVFLAGAFAHGKIDVDWVDEEVSVSQYPLSGSVAVGKLVCAFERRWDIL